MKRFTLYIMLTFTLLLSSGEGLVLRAQFRPSFDTDIQAIRN